MGGFLWIGFLTIPGWFALRSYKSWRRGKQGRPTFAWAWGFVSSGLLVLSVAVVLAVVLAPSQLLVADFEHGPGPFRVGTTPDFSFGVAHGTYEVRSLDVPSGPAHSYAALDREAGAVEVLADVRSTSGAGRQDALGVSCNEPEGTGYFFVVGASGGYWLLKTTDGNSSTLRQDDTFQLPAPGTIEQLDLTCVGDLSGPTELAGRVNGSVIVKAEDQAGYDSFSGVGLTVVALEPDMEVRFEDVQAKVPNS